MSSAALVMLFVGILFIGILFGGLVIKLFDSYKEVRRLKYENRRYTSGEVNQIDFISFLAAYEQRQRAEQNREEILRECIDRWKTESKQDAEKNGRAKQKKQIKERLEKAKV